MSHSVSGQMMVVSQAFSSRRCLQSFTPALVTYIFTDCIILRFPALMFRICSPPATELVCYECSDVIIDIADETMKAELKSIILDRILGEEHGSCSSPAAVICPEESTCGSAKLTIEGHCKSAGLFFIITRNIITGICLC